MCGKIYENGSLKRVLVDGGYIEEGIQTTHYYPYGMSFAESTFADKQPYKYNGKELDTEGEAFWLVAIRVCRE